MPSLPAIGFGTTAIHVVHNAISIRFHEKDRERESWWGILAAQNRCATLVTKLKLPNFIMFLASTSAVVAEIVQQKGMRNAS